VNLKGPWLAMVAEVAPGSTLTEMIRTREADSPGLLDRLKAQTPLRGAADPDEMAQAAAWLLSDRSSYVTGTVLRVDGWRAGLSRGCLVRCRRRPRGARR
jgi:NAD(P)-dependent dehydrogenase (short-subunit alcohol dehydrogenase family)